ncbi:MAG: ABC transporter permease [Pirellulaceae bacterium]|nr:ABC transporter permease [Pirellulaceae bacterium]
MTFLLLIVKNLTRNKIRSVVTALSTMVLVFVCTLVWSILAFLDSVTAEQSQNLKAIVTERWQLPSQMPFAYASSLSEGAASDPDDVQPEDAMTWQFYGGSLDPKNRTRDNSLFAFGLEPDKLLTMMDELDELPPERKAELAAVVDKMRGNRQALIVGRNRLAAINKQVGERIKLFGLNYREIDLEFEIVGVFPEGRYDNAAAFDREYLLAALDAWPATHNGRPHPLAEKTLNLVWLRVPDMQAFTQVDQQIEESPLYASPSVKCETASSGRASFLEAYRDLIWGMRWLLGPAILVTLALVIANAISISVRERRTEFAVLKVLGFRSHHVLLLVLGEALLLGVTAGLLSAGLTYYFVNNVAGGIPFPIAFFQAFYIPLDALGWGAGIGVLTALLGSALPAWSARSVSVSDVFAKVA